MAIMSGKEVLMNLLKNEGVEYVFVNGVLALDKGCFTGSLSGSAIQRE